MHIFNETLYIALRVNTQNSENTSKLSSGNIQTSRHS